MKALGKIQRVRRTANGSPSSHPVVVAMVLQAALELAAISRQTPRGILVNEHTS